MVVAMALCIDDLDCNGMMGWDGRGEERGGGNLILVPYSQRLSGTEGNFALVSPLLGLNCPLYLSFCNLLLCNRGHCHLSLASG